MLITSSALAAEKVSLDLKSHYKESVNATKLRGDVVKDYGMKSDERADQSQKLQHAIDDMAKRGGGSLIIPAGTYRFINVFMASNVHLLVDKGATLKPYMQSGGKGGVMLYFNSRNDSSSDYVENCSIRSLQDGATFKVDYSEYNQKQKIRFIIARMVKNFVLI